MPAERYLPPRLATANDLDVLVRHRIRMFADMGIASPDGFAALTEASRSWFAGALANGTYLGWLIAPAAAPDTVVAGAGMHFLDWAPGNRDLGTTRAYILNVYTEPDHRRHGLATILTRAAIDETRRRGVRAVTLHASDDGRRIYERLGFEESNEMRLLLDLE
jgi:ribosomal protein S18 acetylase RimI-like enzyme